MKHVTTKKIDRAFCTTREAGEMLGVSIGTAQLWVENGLLHAWKTPGGHRRVTRDSIERLLHSRLSDAPSSAPAPLNSDVRRLKVLVVEDDAKLARAYETTLSQWPMAPDVSLANNGIDALLMIERLGPDLLVIDLGIAGIDGFKMLQVLRGNSRYAGMSMVVVSELDVAEIVYRGHLPPGVFLLPKPVPFERLLEIATQVEVRRRAAAGQSAP
ncbi:MAG: response regulator [Rhodoferax sp.]